MDARTAAQLIVYGLVAIAFLGVLGIWAYAAWRTRRDAVQAQCSKMGGNNYWNCNNS